MTSSANHISGKISERQFLGVSFLVLVAAGVLAVGGQSLWIDEANTALKARQPTVADWWYTLAAEKGSDLQMPLYMFWIWGCGKIFGTGEVALRAVNLFWFVPGALALVRVCAGQRARQWAVLLTVASSPFAAYYLNEARPYALQLGASLFLLATLCRWNQIQDSPPAGRGWVWGFGLALVALAGSSLLGLIWVAAALAAVLLVWPGSQWAELLRKNLLAWLTAAGLLAALAGYYVWTLKVGARASAAAATDWKNVIFGGYELLGFAGLGPGRLELRAGGSGVFQAHAFALGFYAVTVGGLLGHGLAELWRSRSRGKVLMLAAVALAPAILILAAGVALHFRVLGRHFTPLAAVLLWVLALGAVPAWRRGAWGRILVVGFLALSLGSVLALRFAARHGKDDYRGAAAVAQAALRQGQTVWWNADVSGARYYQLPLATNVPPVAGQVLWLMNPADRTFAMVGRPDVVLASRRDIYDAGGTLAEFLAREKFERARELRAFTVWRRAKKD